MNLCVTLFKILDCFNYDLSLVKSEVVCDWELIVKRKVYLTKITLFFFSDRRESDNGCVCIYIR